MFAYVYKMIIFLDFLSVLCVLLPMLLSVAYMTIIERKVLASMQRRVGPDTVGWGLGQPFADALKLIIKEVVVPQYANKLLFYIAPIISLTFALLGWLIIPFGSGLTLADLQLGILYTLAVTSLGIFGTLLAGWSANSKYAFLGSMRSTAMMISYELILSSAILIVIFMIGSFSYIDLVENQESIWFIIPLLPVAIIFFISILAESSRVPFDLTEAESELVSGFMTEHSGIIFVKFFLAEYSSIVLLSSLTAIFFFGGYTLPEILDNTSFISLQGFILGLKTCVFCFIFVWFRATLPRLRYDQLITFCWLSLLPVVIAFVIWIPSILVGFDIA